MSQNQHENFVSFPNFVLLVITGHSGYGPGLLPSLRELRCPHWHNLQLPAFILFISALYQAEINPRLVRAAEAAGDGLPCRKEGSRCGSPGSRRQPQDGSRTPGVGTRAGACHGPRLQSLGFETGVGFRLFVCFVNGLNE